MTTNTHPTVKMTPPWSTRPVLIDAGIAELIGKIWQLGIGTFSCCQENEPGIMAIAFYTADDAERFVKVAGGFRDPAINVNRWLINATFNSFTGELRLSISMRFPVAEYPAILANVSRAIVTHWTG